MPSRRSVLGGLLGAVLAVALGPPAATDGQAQPARPQPSRPARRPPPPRFERRPRPRPGFVWVPGRWVWSHRRRRYVWVPGRWERRRRR